MILKTKLSLGLGLLFAIIIAIVVFSSYYISKMSADSDNILKDNYNSLVYSQNMGQALDDMKTAVTGLFIGSGLDAGRTDYYTKLFAAGKTVFDKNLNDEKNNITEINEREYVEALEKSYEVFFSLSLMIQKGARATPAIFNEFVQSCEKVRESIRNINDVNMQAIVRKSRVTGADAANIISTMAIIGTLCIILAFAYFWYFPFYVSNSISYLSDKMKDLLKKMGIKLDTQSNDETHIILQSINLIENKLKAGGTQKTAQKTKRKKA
jgi:hypothetical protein